MGVEKKNEAAKTLVVFTLRPEILGWYPKRLLEAWTPMSRR